MRPLLVALSLLCAVSPCLAQSAVLVDAAGAQVGQVVDLNLRTDAHEAEVAVIVDGRGGVLPISDTRTSLGGFLAVLFTGDGCTGAAYLRTDFGLSELPLFGEYFFVAGAGGDLYAFSHPTSESTPQIESTWIPQTGVCSDVSFSASAAGPMELVRPGYGAEFVPPFRFVVVPTSAAAVSVPAVGAAGLAILGVVLSILGVVVLRRL